MHVLNKIICAIAFVLLAIYIPAFAQEDVTPTAIDSQSVPAAVAIPAPATNIAVIDTPDDNGRSLGNPLGYVTR